MSKPTVGFIGLGRLGLPFAVNLVADGYEVVGTKRGRSDEFVEKGGKIAGDGSARAVAEEADIIFTCVQGPEQLEDALAGDDGVLCADGAPMVIELSTVPIPVKVALQEQVAARGGALLDCPVSGTPDMAAAKAAAIFVSGDKDAADRVTEHISAIAPKNVYVGPLGHGTKFKVVANHLAFIHVTAAAEAMALAGALGLDKKLVAAVISKSDGATSGQFNIRAPLMAEENFDSRLVTVDQMKIVCDIVVAAAERAGAATPLMSTVSAVLDDFAASGAGDDDPAKLSVYLSQKAGAQAR